MIVEGIVSGLATGVILGLFFGGRDTLNRYLERRHRISYLASLVKGTREYIYQSTDSRSVPADKTALLFKARTEIYRELRRSVETVLEGRSSVISFSEVNEIRSVFGVWDRTPDYMLNDANCDAVFEGLESIKWLKLSKGCQLRPKSSHFFQSKSSHFGRGVVPPGSVLGCWTRCSCG